MSPSPSPPDPKRELLATLQEALGATSSLAGHLASDPLVGDEARGLLGRLDCIRAEVEVFAALKGRSWRNTDKDASASEVDHHLWQ